MNANENDTPPKKRSGVTKLLYFLLCYVVSLAVYLGVVWLTAGSFPDISLIISVFGSIFTATGLYILIDTITETRGKNERCTVAVTGSVCGCETEFNEGKQYRSRFLFQYNGRSYIVKDVAASSRCPNIGEEVDLMINPSYPNDYYSPSRRRKTNHLLYLVSFVFGVTPLITVAAAYFTR